MARVSSPDFYAHTLRVDDDIRGRPAVDGLVHPLIIEYTVLGHFYYEGRVFSCKVGLGPLWRKFY